MSEDDLAEYERLFFAEDRPRVGSSSHSSTRKWFLGTRYWPGSKKFDKNTNIYQIQAMIAENS